MHNACRRCMKPSCALIFSPSGENLSPPSWSHQYFGGTCLSIGLQRNRGRDDVRMLLIKYLSSFWRNSNCLWNIHEDRCWFQIVQIPVIPLILFKTRVDRYRREIQAGYSPKDCFYRKDQIGMMGVFKVCFKNLWLYVNVNKLWRVHF